MPPQRMTVRDSWMIEIATHVMPHPDLLHHTH
jgi:hypothetical protein